MCVFVCFAVYSVCVCVCVFCCVQRVCVGFAVYSVRSAPGPDGDESTLPVLLRGHYSERHWCQATWGYCGRGLKARALRVCVTVCVCESPCVCVCVLSLNALILILPVSTSYSVSNSSVS